MIEDMKKLTKKDFVSDQDVRWCPGCGDYAILAQVQKIFPDLGIPKKDFLALSTNDQYLCLLPLNISLYIEFYR